MNLFTVDLEDWYHTSGMDIPADQWDRYEDRIQASTMKLLDLLDEFHVRAVFFILGCVAEKHPELVREVSRRGHEIGSHGSRHRMVDRMSLEEFRLDLRHSLRVLEDVTGQTIRCYRAPSWSISPERFEALSILDEEGIICDSSLQPIRTPLSGNGDTPVHPFRPIVDGRRLNLIEIPPSVMTWAGLKIPFAGGLYLRFWPSWFAIYALNRVNRSRAGMLYVHPWELDTGFPKLEVPPLIKFAQYFNLRTTEAKLRALFSRFSYTTLEDYMADKQFPEFHLRSKRTTGSPSAGAGT